MAEVIAKEHLVQFIKRLEKLEQEKSDIMEDIKEVLAEAKGSGFDTKIIKQILKIMKSDKTKLAEQEAILELYREVLEL